MAYKFDDVRMEAHKDMDRSTGRLIVDGVIGRLSFPNGYGISVIRFGTTPRSCSGGALQGLYEVAVLDKNGELCYSTPITNDVIGYQSEDDVTTLMNRIAALPPSAT